MGSFANEEGAFAAPPSLPGASGSAAPRSGRIAAVLPCYKSRAHLRSVVARFGQEVERIYLVDDACPEHTVADFMRSAPDARATPIYLKENLGVGGATKAGYVAALKDGFDIIVKVDSDGQMDPAFIPALISPIARGRADYTKGNRFFSLDNAKAMPRTRFLGNLMLSFVSKLSSGYWEIFDPTNGFTAIHRSALALLPLEKIESRYFFESDMLFRLNTVGTVVQDAPMLAHYGDEISGLHPGREVIRFGVKHIHRFGKRLFYRYFLRGVSPGTVFLLLAFGLLVGAIIYAAAYIAQSNFTGVPSSPGEVMVGGVMFILAAQMAIAFLLTDMQPPSVDPLQVRGVVFLQLDERQAESQMRGALEPRSEKSS